MGLMDTLRPFERRELTGLSPALGAGLDPQTAYSILQQVMSGAQTRAADMQSNRQDQLGAAFEGLSGYAGSGYATPEGLGGLSQAYQAMSPALSRPQGQGALSEIVQGLGPYAESVQPPDATQTLPAEDLPAIDQDVQAAVSGVTKGPNGLPYGLHELMLHVVSQYRAQGFSEEVLDQLRSFVTQRWQEYGGAERPGGGY